ncbi:MAG: RNA polymerase sigma factor [Aquabacterium sp.]|uniref:RNA polymerase sigma factor n=1 Tax=Aquabacterium sp. TaxID=1872578 RepID=UPI0012294B1F|nr:RNA polymerase sigma factor [Aquabacterium sp.]TAK90855.1 MAG: RNA polymerase sigma factor [Aquabacterium sp.]
MQISDKEDNILLPDTQLDHVVDGELVRLAGQGDAQAFTAIMRKYNRLMFRSVRGVVHDDAEAQDAVQDAYLRAFGALPQFRGEASLGTWLVRIAIHAALDAQRKRGRHVRLDDMDEQERQALEDRMAIQADASAQPDALAERSQLSVLLQRSVDSLPPMYRSVFVLRAVEEMSVQDTAACLQVSEEVVKTRYLRARTMLRDALGAQLEPHIPGVYAFAGARCEAVVRHVLAQLTSQGRIAAA